jgi:CelD/BcsL family acetyltransferase involved in cellulose biosynthesis
MLIGLPQLAGRATKSSPFSHEIRVCADLKAFAALRDEWNNLEAAAASHSFCLSYAYCETAAGFAFAKGARVVVVMARDGVDLCALWPLVICREGLLRVARPLGCGSNDEYGAPLLHARAGSKALPDVLSELLQAAMHIRADILEARFLRADGALQDAIAPLRHSWWYPFIPRRLRELPGYSVSLTEYERWEDYSATLSKSLRAELRAHLRRLTAKGRPEFGWCNTVEDAEAVLTWLFATKRRWAISRGFKTQYLMNDQARDFFIALARRVDLSVDPFVIYLKLDGRPVAASVNLVGAESFEGFVMTYDESLSACSPGLLLQEWCMKWAHANGRDFDFRPFQAAYKLRWASRVSRLETHTFFLSVRGRLAEFSLLSAYIGRAARGVTKVIARRVRLPKRARSEKTSKLR